MRWWLAVLVGLAAVILVSAAVGGQDNTGESVRASAWADDVCGAVGAWEGQIEGISDEIALHNVGTRRHDGGSGDDVQGSLYVRGIVDRVIDATEDTLQQGIERAGFPDTADGRAAAVVLADWAQDTETALRVAKNALNDRPDTTVAAFAALGVAVATLERAVVEGREAFVHAAAADDEIAEAIDGSRACDDLRREEP